MNSNIKIKSDTPRILSVQSHVVSGYCGNKSATFPLQLLEIEVDIINSVQLSNHTQYKVTKGQIFESKDLESLHLGLKSNNLLTLYDHVLSGYVADVSYLQALAKLIKEIKEARSNLSLSCWYTCDPVLGEDGNGYYVPDGPNIAHAYRQFMIPLADIITPNRFEASIITGQEIDPSSEDALNQCLSAIDKFHQMGVTIVALTSVEFADTPDTLTSLLSFDPTFSSTTLKDIPTSEKSVWKICIPKLACPFTGTGDLFTALLTGWLCKTNFDLIKSFENTVNSIHQILENTLERYKLINDGLYQSFELRLVQNKEYLMAPTPRFRASKLQIYP